MSDLLRQDYNPNQPRDSRGRFGSGGGGAGIALKKSPFIGIKTKFEVTAKLAELKASTKFSPQGFAKLQKQYQMQQAKLDKIQAKDPAKYEKWVAEASKKAGLAPVSPVETMVAQAKAEAKAAGFGEPPQMTAAEKVAMLYPQAAAAVGLKPPIQPGAPTPATPPQVSQLEIAMKNKLYGTASKAELAMIEASKLGVPAASISGVQGKNPVVVVGGKPKQSPFIGIKTQAQVDAKLAELKASGKFSYKGLQKLQKMHAAQSAKLEKIKTKDPKKYANWEKKAAKHQVQLTPDSPDIPSTPQDVSKKSFTPTTPTPSPPTKSYGPSIGSVTAKPFNDVEAVAHRSKAYNTPPPATKEMRDAVHSYTGSGYSSMNAALRASGGQSSSQKVAEMDKLIDRAVLDRDIAVYRGFSGSGLTGLSVGDIFQDHGYVSTSSNHSTADSFAGYSGVVMHIQVKKGQRGLVPHSQFPGEKEVILPRSSKFKILSMTQSPSVAYGKTKTIVHVEVED